MWTLAFALAFALAATLDFVTLAFTLLFAFALAAFALAAFALAAFALAAFALAAFALFGSGGGGGIGCTCVGFFSPREDEPRSADGTCFRLLLLLLLLLAARYIVASRRVSWAVHVKCPCRACRSCSLWSSWRIRARVSAISARSEPQQICSLGPVQLPSSSAILAIWMSSTSSCRRADDDAIKWWRCISSIHPVNNNERTRAHRNHKRGTMTLLLKGANPRCAPTRRMSPT